MTEAAPQPAPARAGGLFGWRLWLPRAVFESVLIVFSVFLALALSEWAENRRAAERVETIRGFLVGELRANRELVRSTYHLPHHQRLREQLATVPRSGPLTPEERKRAGSPLDTGVHPVYFRDAVWRSVSGSELLEHMNPREVFMLPDVYRLQDELTLSNRAMLTGDAGMDLISGDEARIREGALAYWLWLGDVVAMEQRLLVLYERALKRLGADPQAAEVSRSAQ